MNSKKSERSEKQIFESYSPDRTAIRDYSPHSFKTK